MNYKPTKIKDICGYTLFNKIKQHAHGSLYKLNAGSADCYAFNIINNGKDWEGGWDWSNDLIDKNADYILMLTNNKVLKINL